MALNDIGRISGDRPRQTVPGADPAIRHGRRNGKILDYDDLGRHLRLEKIKKGLTREQIQERAELPKAVEKSLAARTLQTSRPVRALNAAEIRRHARLTGAPDAIAHQTLAILRGGPVTPGRPATGREAMREYLALQKAKLAAAAGSLEEFVAQMAPLPDFSGDATELSRRFYEASSNDDQLDQLLESFRLPGRERDKLKSRIRECPQHHQTGYQTAELAKVLAGALQIESVPAGAEAARLLTAIDDRLDELETDEAAGRYIGGALNIADEAEQAADPARFADDYAELIHGNDNWGSKCLSVFDRYLKQGQGEADLHHLPRTLEAASRAADLDLHSDFPSTDKVRLQVAIESMTLIARMRTVAEAVEESAQFIERHFGKPVAPTALLRTVLEILANPYAASSSLAALSGRLELTQPEHRISLYREAGKAVRLMQQIYADANAADAAQTGVQDALDSAIAQEEALLDEAERGPVIASTAAMTVPPPPHLMP